MLYVLFPYKEYKDAGGVLIVNLLNKISIISPVSATFDTKTMGCGITVELQIIIDVQEIANKYNIRVFPNPSTGKLIISGENIQSIELLNQEGKSIQKVIEHSGDMHLDLSRYARGVYFIKFELADETFVRKIVLE